MNHKHTIMDNADAIQMRITHERIQPLVEKIPSYAEYSDLTEQLKLWKGKERKHNVAYNVDM